LARLICEDVIACLKDMIHSGTTPGSSAVDSTSEPGSTSLIRHSGRKPWVSRLDKGALIDLKTAPVAKPTYSSSPSPGSSVSVGSSQYSQDAARVQMPQIVALSLRLLGDVFRALGFSIAPGVEQVRRQGTCTVLEVVDTANSLLRAARAYTNLALWQVYFGSYDLSVVFTADSVGARVQHLLVHARRKLRGTPVNWLSSKDLRACLLLPLTGPLSPEEVRKAVMWCASKFGHDWVKTMVMLTGMPCYDPSLLENITYLIASLADKVKNELCEVNRKPVPVPTHTSSPPLPRDFQRGSAPTTLEVDPPPAATSQGEIQNGTVSAGMLADLHAHCLAHKELPEEALGGDLLPEESRAMSLALKLYHSSEHAVELENSLLLPMTRRVSSLTQASTSSARRLKPLPLDLRVSSLVQASTSSTRRLQLLPMTLRASSLVRAYSSSACSLQQPPTV